MGGGQRSMVRMPVHKLGNWLMTVSLLRHNKAGCSQEQQRLKRDAPPGDCHKTGRDGASILLRYVTDDGLTVADTDTTIVCSLSTGDMHRSGTPVGMGT